MEVGTLLVGAGSRSRRDRVNGNLIARLISL